jgi:conjugal transfer pilus assembly protein TraB
MKFPSLRKNAVVEADASDLAGSGTGAAASAAPSSAADPLAGINARVAQRQRYILAAMGVVVLGASASYVLSRGDSNAELKAEDPGKISISTGDMLGKNLALKEWRAQSQEQMDGMTARLKTMEAKQPGYETNSAKIAALEQENEKIKADGARLFKVYEEQNTAQAAKLKALESGTAPDVARGGGNPSRWKQPVNEPFRVGGAGPDGQGVPGGPGGTMSVAEVKTISFAPAAAKGAGRSEEAQGFVGVRPDAPPTVIEASPDYLPPNSYATARVIVGVDASAGVNSQTDPLPVVLRITGPARSVINNGKLLTTRLEGCVVNGAARGDLSAEKVYVKLAKMTCDQPGGRVAVSEVKGFISFAGKTGVRGKVVSREGSLVTQAFLAGVAGGFGRGFSANANAIFQGGTTVVNGERQQLSPGELATAGLGQGVAQSADMVGKYLIERAEQYQPVIEMPTGIEVEIVFLDGVYVRGSQ